MMNRVPPILAAALTFATATFADPAALPRWVDASAGFVVPYRLPDGASIASATIQYPGGDTVPLEVAAISVEEGVEQISAPPAADPQPGVARVRIVLNTEEAVEIEMPISLYVEIDITGPAAESLLTPLPDDAYLVDYIPCCNIYGGLLIAERIPVNPEDSDIGLPAQLISDFVRLEPDGLTASTMGLYFEFGYTSDLPAERIGLYEWGINTWREVFEYTVNPETRRIRYHCPNGGIFVTAEKPAIVEDDRTD